MERLETRKTDNDPNFRIGATCWKDACFEFLSPLKYAGFFFAGHPDLANSRLKWLTSGEPAMPLQLRIRRAIIFRD